jgi:tetratricopeptide (TPR) repeat protein
MCYFRLGSYDEARVILKESLKGLEDADAELRAKAYIRRAHLEVWTGRYHDALDILREAQSFFESCNDAIKGRWHGQLAMVLRRLGAAEDRAEYIDRAIIEYEASAYHLEQANHERYSAITLNNLAFLLYKLKRFKGAHENLNRAVRLLRRLNDNGLLAQVNETRARVFLAEGKPRESNRVIGEVLQVLEKGDEAAPLVDALRIQGVIWARTGNYASSLNVLRRALRLATKSGATSNAARVALSLIEEHGKTRLPELDLYKVYRRADSLLRNTQDAEELARLRVCARIVTARLSGELIAQDFKLPDAMLTYEARFIEQALEMEEGSVSRAAKRLGIKRQSLTHMLETRHKQLLAKRTPIRKRGRSLIKKKP